MLSSVIPVSGVWAYFIEHLSRDAWRACSSCCGFARQSLVLAAGYLAARLKLLAGRPPPSSSPYSSVRPFPCLTAAPSGLSVGYCPDIPKSGASSKACLSTSAASHRSVWLSQGFSSTLVRCDRFRADKGNPARKGRPVVSFFRRTKGSLPCDAGSVQSVNQKWKISQCSLKEGWEEETGEVGCWGRFIMRRKWDVQNDTISASVPCGNYFNALIRFSLAKVTSPGDKKFPTGQECLGSSRVEETSSN